MHTQEKLKTKKVDKTGDTAFEKVELTSGKAKDLEEPGPINVSDEKGETTPAPPPQTQGKPKKYKFPTPYVTPQTQEEPKKYKFPTPYVTPQTQEKPKKYKFPTPYVTPQTQDVTPQTQEKGPKKWPKPIQDWVDKGKAADDAWHKWEEQYKHLIELKHDQPFVGTPEGQKEFEKEIEKLNDAEKAAKEASAAAAEAGKNIDQATKDAVEQAERDRKAAGTDNQKKDEKPRP